MRRLLNLTLLLSGCQLLPAKDQLCSDTDRCPKSVTAPFVLGQPNGQTNWLVNGIGRVGGVLMTAGKLLVSDASNNRVLIWNSFPTRNNQPPDQWLGQPDLSVVSYSLQDSYLVYTPTRLATDGTTLVVASDSSYGGSSRPLLFYSPFPMGNDPAYTFLMNPAVGPMPGPHTFDGASPLFYNGRLYVGDRGFNRLLIFSTTPTTQTSDAAYVLGQPTLTGSTANNGGVSATSMSGPEGTPATDGTMLFVPDTQNHRVLGYNTLPTASNTAADFALGQTSLTANSANGGGAASLSTLNSPTGLAIGGVRLAVADRGNHRVLLWNTLPTSSGQQASTVLGQPNGISTSYNAVGVTGSTLYSPTAVATDGTRLVVGDSSNYRVLLWNTWPMTSGTAANLVLGQATLTSNGYLGQSTTGGRQFRPTSLTRAGSSLIVADSDANRVLIYPQLPVDATASPVLVLGQADLVGSGASSSNVSASTMYGPTSVSTDGTRLAVADSSNHRVLLWNSIPTVNRQPADVVLGQPTTTGSNSNAGGIPLGFYNPQAVFLSGGRLYVADTSNHRVLIWKSVPTQNQQPPDLVLGQSDFAGGSADHGSKTSDATTMESPRGVCADAGHIYVSDTGDNRVLIWNTLDPVNGQGADVVIGAPDFASYGRIYSPYGIQVARGRLYVAESGSNRISVWNSIPTQNGLPPATVIGQSDLSGTAPNPGGLGPAVLQRPTSMLLTDVGLYIADSGNGRIVALPPTP